MAPELLVVNQYKFRVVSDNAAKNSVGVHIDGPNVDAQNIGM